MNYFNDLPEDLQELIYKEEHKLKLHDIWNEINKRGWYFPINEEVESSLHIHLHGSLFLTLNNIPHKLKSEKVICDFYIIWLLYEMTYSESIFNLPKNKDKDYDDEVEEMYERNDDYEYNEFIKNSNNEVEEYKPNNLVYDESEDESEF